MLSACSSGDGTNKTLAKGDLPNGNTGSNFPPVASLTDGQWLAGDLHVHSEHSNDSTLNPISKIVALADSVGLQYLVITDHDNHVEGDVASHTWADPDFPNSPLIMLYGVEWTTHRGHGNPFSAQHYDHQCLYDVRDRYDVEIGALK
ncbi:MAG: PHP domain-containing protein [Halioglobus sp.]